MIEVELPDGRILEIETLDVNAGARAATAFMNRERNTPSPAAQPMGNQDMLARTLRGNPPRGLPGPVVAQTAEGRGFAPLPRTMKEVGQRMGAVLRGQVEPTLGERYGMDVPLGWVAGSGGRARDGIRAYHGSPHTFDRFDMSRIGTGEGAQAYGHGLYFAGDEGVARSYRDALTPKIDPRERVNNLLNNLPFGVARADIEIAAAGLGVRLQNSQIDDIAAALKGRNADGTVNQSAIDAIQRLDRSLPRTQGSMYEVRLNTTPDRLLDWHKPLSRQGAVGATTRDLLTDLYKINATGIFNSSMPIGKFENVFKGQDLMGADAVRSASGLQGAAAVSSAFREAGIPGIQYLDAGSRAAGEGTRNYVMFDDSLIDILRRYGWAGILAGFGAAGSAEAQPSQGKRIED